MPGSKVSPTISDVARRAGVSIATVSRVLNENTPVAPETVARVQAAIAELEFVPRAAARGLASHRTHTLGLVLPEIGLAFFTPLLKGIEDEARQARYDLLIQTTQSPNTARPSLRGLGQHNTDGLIIFTNSIEDTELVRLHRNSFPMVLLHQTPPEGIQIPVITMENKLGTRRIVEHLIEHHGYRKIAFLQGPEENEDSEWRERGYREALEVHGIPFQPALVAKGGFDEAEASAAVQAWLMDGVEFEAIFCGDDDAASGVLSALREAGQRVPEQVAVAGFDDSPLARFLTPPLTTVRAPIEQIGRQAVKQLVRLIQDGQADPITMLPTEPVIRQSCGCPASLGPGSGDGNVGARR